MIEHHGLEAVQNDVKLLISSRLTVLLQMHSFTLFMFLPFKAKQEWAKGDEAHLDVIDSETVFILVRHPLRLYLSPRFALSFEIALSLRQCTP